MQVILIRHGMTAGNAQGKYIGRTDEPLSPEGIALAQQMGSDPAVRTVYVSPLRRTQQTAAILFPSAQQIIVDDLREMDFGDFENRNFAQMEHDEAYRAWVEDGCTAPCPNGEGREEFSHRVCAAFSEIIMEAAARGEETVVFVVHGGTVMAVMERFARPKGEFYSYGVKNCRGYRCRISAADGSCTLTEAVLWDGVEQTRENPV